MTQPLKHGMYGQQQNKEESLKLSLYMAFMLFGTREIKFYTMVAKLTLLLLPGTLKIGSKNLLMQWKVKSH